LFKMLFTKRVQIYIAISIAQTIFKNNNG